jgi:nucleoid-associated protein YgaU
VRRIVWLGSAAAAVLIVLALVIGLRGTAPPKSPAPATSPLPTPTATNPAPAAPAKPPGADIVRPSFDIVRVDPQGQAVIAGQAAPGDRVRVLDGDKPIGEVTADARGEWVLLPDAPLAPGNRQLSLEATSQDGGGPARRSGDVVALSVIPPAAAGGSPSTLAVLLPGDPDKPARVLQQDQTAAGQQLSLETAEYGAHNRLMLSGHADPASRLNVYAGDRLIGTVTADSAGKWSLAAPPPEPAGGVELRLDELAADGTVAHRIAAPFEAIGAPKMAKGGLYVVRSGNSLWVIARQLYGEGFRYATIYSANRGQIRDPNLIYPGQTFKLPKS